MAFITVLIVHEQFWRLYELCSSWPNCNGDQRWDLKEKNLEGWCLDSSTKTLSGDKKELAGSWAFVEFGGNATGQVAFK